MLGLDINGSTSAIIQGQGGIDKPNENEYEVCLCFYSSKSSIDFKSTLLGPPPIFMFTL